MHEINFKPSKSGSPRKIKYRSVITRDGDIVLKEDGFIETDLEIQSYRDSVDLNVIIQRYLAGDTNAIPDPSKAVFADLMQMPQNRQQVLQSVIDAQRAFDELPLSVRSDYGHDWQAWYIAFENASQIPGVSETKESEAKDSKPKDSD